MINDTSDTRNDTVEHNATFTKLISSVYNLNQEDSNWIVTNSFIIFTMQTGFGMLESGCVSLKNEVNIMMKNVVDIVLGGLTYWMFGFGMSFGRSEFTNPFIGLGDFLIDPTIEDEFMGPECAAFLFQLSFATTATTIVSGAMAERCNFKAYCLFSFLNTIVYCVPAGWVWGDHGFLKRMGAVDIAGSGTVHLVGGTSALACAMMLGPRLGRYDNGIDQLPLGCPVNAIMGLFVLWWGWLAFNSGSTYGVSGQRWKYAARAAVSTMLSSMGGGLIGLGFSLANPKRIDILSQINGILGALVSVTAWEALIVGIIGALISCTVMPALDRVGIDDPVGASAVHGACGMWGVLAIGFFADNPYPLSITSGRKGLFKGGGGYLLAIQSLTVICLAVWSFLTSIILLWMVNKVIPIRMSVKEELLGADLVEHSVRHAQIGVSRAMSVLRPFSRQENFDEIVQIGINPGHESYLTRYNRIRKHDRLLKFLKRQTRKRKSSGSVKIHTISGPDINTKKDAEPRFAWID
ncbi:putative ammonium transporter 3 isoform X2 [Cephus cinctus]|uniref:Ammonium transporter n=1 Tax=Cephus cinctus TaxID=211228 RepID=A0AAJ7FQ05_CEPCN|nr:putative ammonium transporter 3 isoform X2 [Cephus cinctus]